MRTILAWALILLLPACADRTEPPATTGALATIPAGPDPVVLRVSRGGGLVSAISYPGLDSVVWRSSYRVPALERVLAYHADDGYLTAVDTSGRPVRLDLRLGAVAVPGSAGGMQHASADGSTLYAVNAKGNVARYTPVGDGWTITPDVAPSALIPLNDGSVVIATRGPDDVLLRRVRPPDSAVVDSVRLNITADNATIRGVTVGDRMFLSAGDHVLSLRTRDFVVDVDVAVGAPVREFVTSPSGDRMFVLVTGANTVFVVDRFQQKVSERVALAGEPGGLRMDPLGRVLLVRAANDSAYVIELGNSALVGTVRTTWRGDLPLVFADGAIALAHSDTLTLASSLDLGVVRTIPDGAKDFWYAMRWNGFRPRAEGLDEPVRFRESSGSVAARAMAADTLDSLARDSVSGMIDARTLTNADPTMLPAPAVDPRGGFTVQLAAVLSEDLAREAAAGITVEGRTPRIVSSVRDGRTLYRVVLGPYATRDAAERAGKASGSTYWVFEGAP